MHGKAVEFPSYRDAKAQSVLERTWDKDSPPMLALEISPKCLDLLPHYTTSELVQQSCVHIKSNADSSVA